MSGITITEEMIKTASTLGEIQHIILEIKEMHQSALAETGRLRRMLQSDDEEIWRDALARIDAATAKLTRSSTLAGLAAAKEATLYTRQPPRRRHRATL